MACRVLLTQGRESRQVRYRSWDVVPARDPASSRCRPTPPGLWATCLGSGASHTASLALQLPDSLQEILPILARAGFDICKPRSSADNQFQQWHLPPLCLQALKLLPSPYFGPVVPTPMPTLQHTLSASPCSFPFCTSNGRWLIGPIFSTYLLMKRHSFHLLGHYLHVSSFIFCHLVLFPLEL